MFSGKVTRKGQVTIPAEYRDKFDLHEGDLVTFGEADGGVLVRSQRDIVRRTAGSLSKYAKNRPVTDEEMDASIERAVVEDYLDSLENDG